MTHRRRSLLNTALMLSCATLTGCSESGSGAAERPSRTDPAVQQAREQAAGRKQLERVSRAEPEAVQGEVPADVMSRVTAHLAQRTGADADGFEVVRAEAREWPSGAMGCPQPGMHYTQAVVNGYWIVLRHEERDYDYRVAGSGHFVLCEGMHLEQAPTR